MISEEMRDHNLAMMLGCLSDGKGHSRSNLAQETGLAPSSITALAKELTNAGLVRTVAASDTARPILGRRKEQLFLNGDEYAVIAIELQLDGAHTTVMNLTGDVLDDTFDARDFRNSVPEDFAACAAHVIARAMERMDEWGMTSIPAVGLVIPGPILEDRATVYAALDFGWKDPCDLRSATMERLAELLKIHAPAISRRLPEIVVLNDARSAAWAEYRHLCDEEPQNPPRNVMYITETGGIGGTVIINGKVYEGSRGMAFIPGHISVDPNGALCGCGQRGCVSTIVGVAPLLEAVGMAGYDKQVGLHKAFDELMRREQAGDPAVCAAFRRADAAFRTLLDAMCISFAPDAVILGGFLARRIDINKQSGLCATAMLGLGRDDAKGLDAIHPDYYRDKAIRAGALMLMRERTINALPRLLRGEEW